MNLKHVQCWIIKKNISQCFFFPRLYSKWLSKPVWRPMRNITISVHRAADHFGTKLLRYISMTTSVDKGIRLRYIDWSKYVPFQYIHFCTLVHLRTYITLPLTLSPTPMTKVWTNALPFTQDHHLMYSSRYTAGTKTWNNRRYMVQPQTCTGN